MIFLRVSLNCRPMLGNGNTIVDGLQPSAGIVDTGSVWQVILPCSGFLCAIIIAVVLAYKYWPRKKIFSVEKTLNSFEQVFRDLKSARKCISGDLCDVFAMKISSAVRTYIRREFNIKAEYITTEEFLDKFISNVDNEWYTISIVTDLLKLSDMAKFARRKLSIAQQRGIYSKACQFVRIVESKKRKEYFARKLAEKLAAERQMVSVQTSSRNKKHGERK